MCYQCLCPFIWIKFVFVFLNFGTTRKEMPKKCDCNLLCSKRPRIVFAHLRPFNNISTKHFPGNAIVFYTCTDVVVFFFTYMDPLISIDFPIRQTFGHLFETCSNKVINCLVCFCCRRSVSVQQWLNFDRFHLHFPTQSSHNAEINGNESTIFENGW